MLNDLKNDISKKIDEIINCNNLKTNKTCIYISGKTGCGKTYFVNKILDKNKFNIIWFSSTDIINKYVINKLTSSNLSNRGVLSYMDNENKNNIIVIDDFEDICQNDKNILTILIKYIRPKKTKKQNLDDYFNNPIIIINNSNEDKKLLELKKYSYCYSIQQPTYDDLQLMIKNNLPSITKKNMDLIINNSYNNYCRAELLINLMKDNIIYDIIYHNETISNSKQLTKTILNNEYSIENYYENICDSDRTTISLIYHENLPNSITNNSYLFYQKILNNFCFCDYIDRFMFQKQLWELNEYSNLIKLVGNNSLIVNNSEIFFTNIKNILFTKILTKYSSEYNNLMYMIKLCNKFYCTKNQLYTKIMLSNPENKDVLRYLNYHKITST